MTLDELNAVVFDILGDEHELVIKLKAEDEPIPVSDVMISLIAKLDERLKALEERSIH